MTAGSRAALDAAFALCIVALAWEPNYAHGFINYNESGQHLVALRELGRGAELFRDVFVQYGPLHYYVPALAFELFGSSIATLRGYFLAGGIASLLAAFALARVALRPPVFAWAASLAVVVHSHHPFWATRWGGFRFAFVYLALAALLKSRSRGSIGWGVAAGALAALAALHTYDAGLAALVGALAFYAHELWSRRGAARSPRAAPTAMIASFLAGYAAVLAPALAKLVLAGTLGDFLDQLPLRGADRAWLQPTRAQDLSAGVLAPAVAFAVAAVVLVVRGHRKQWRSQRDLPLLLLTVSGGLLYAAAFRAIRGPQLETSLPLAILTAFHLMASGAGRAARLRTGSIRPADWAALWASGLAAVYFVGVEIRAYGGGIGAWASYQYDKTRLVPRYRGAEPIEPGFRPIRVEGASTTRTSIRQAEEIEGVVSFLRTHTSPDEPLFAYPDLAIFNALADRPTLTRFSIPILAAPREVWASEVLDALARARPRFALRSTGLSTLARATLRRSEYLPEAGAYLGLHYEPVDRFGSIEVLRLREREP